MIKKLILCQLVMLISSVSLSQFEIGNSKLNIGIGVSGFAIKTRIVPTNMSFEDSEIERYRGQFRPSLLLAWRSNKIGLELSVNQNKWNHDSRITTVHGIVNKKIVKIQ